MQDTDAGRIGLTRCPTCNHMNGELTYPFYLVSVNCRCSAKARANAEAKPQYALFATYVGRDRACHKLYVPLVVAKPEELLLRLNAPTRKLKHRSRPLMRNYVCTACAAGHHWDCLGDLETPNYLYRCNCGKDVGGGYCGHLAWHMRQSENRAAVRNAKPITFLIQ